MKKAYFSKRIKKKTLLAPVVSETAKSLEIFNLAKRTVFQTLVQAERKKSEFDKSIHLQVKECFKVTDYYSTSIVGQASALHKSQKALNKLYIKQTDEKIKKLKKKIKSTKSKLTTLRKIKESLIKGELRFPKNSRFSLHKSGLVSQSVKNKSNIWLNTYLFEHQYVDVQIKRLKSRSGQFQHRLKRLEQKKEKLKRHIPSVVFGTKKLFKAQHTKEEYKRNHSKWKKEFDSKRNKQMIISGRKDAGAGNFVFNYNTSKAELTYTSVTGKVVVIPGVVFPYGQEIVNAAVETQLNCKNKKAYGKPISWSIEDHGDYYIVKCLIDVEENEWINFSTSDGVLSVDSNIDHLAWCDVTKDGNYKQSGRIHFSIQGKTTGQATKIIEAVAIKLVDKAVEMNKPIGLENIDTTLSKTGDAYGNKKANRLKSIFAYRKMAQAIKSRANKMGVAVLEVNPAYTSISGKMKYMRKFGISIHQAAAFTIGRRTLGYKEKAPKVLKKYIFETNSHHWKHWSNLNKKLQVSTPAFYGIFNVNKPEQSIILNHKSLTDLEKKQLNKAFA